MSNILRNGLMIIIPGPNLEKKDAADFEALAPRIKFFF